MRPGSGRIVRSPEADGDLISIWRFGTEERSPELADRQLYDLQQMCDWILDTPKTYRLSVPVVSCLTTTPRAVYAISSSQISAPAVALPLCQLSAGARKRADVSIASRHHCRAYPAAPRIRSRASSTICGHRSVKRSSSRTSGAGGSIGAGRVARDARRLHAEHRALNARPHGASYRLQYDVVRISSRCHVGRHPQWIVTRKIPANDPMNSSCGSSRIPARRPPERLASAARRSPASIFRRRPAPASSPRAKQAAPSTRPAGRTDRFRFRSGGEHVRACAQWQPQSLCRHGQVQMGGGAGCSDH